MVDVAGKDQVAKRKAFMLEQRSRKIDVVALCLLALVVFLTVALVTYHPADLPNAQQANATVAAAPVSRLAMVTAKIVNACGRSGAYAAEGLYRLLGWGGTISLSFPWRCSISGCWPDGRSAMLPSDSVAG